MSPPPRVEPRPDERASACGPHAIPPGQWAVGVSGGADSVALLFLLRRDRPDLAVHVVHLDHETRAGASARDAEFVRTLAARLQLPCTIQTRSSVEAGLTADLSANPSARFRAARLALFRRVVVDHGLAGVLLAHHADDQAETVLHRLIRGSGPGGLTGMRFESTVGGLRILRPLLGYRRDELRAVLRANGETWREDASNASDDYLRNRLRRVLSGEPQLTPALLRLADSCRAIREWTQAHAPAAGDFLNARDLLALSSPLGRELARSWLARAGVPQDRIEPAVVSRLLAMAADAASPARQHFPGRVLVRRTRGVFSVATSTGVRESG